MIWKDSEQMKLYEGCCTATNHWSTAFKLDPTWKCVCMHARLVFENQVRHNNVSSVDLGHNHPSEAHVENHRSVA